MLFWNVAVNFSIYTPLRTGDLSFAARDKDRLREFREKIDQLMDFKRQTGRIFTTESVLKKYYEFFANNCFIPNCQAGRRSAVINPDGRIASCAMQPGSYDTLDELVNNFSKGNSCGGCYVSLRANTEKTFGMLIKDGWSSYRQMRRNGS